LEGVPPELLEKVKELNQIAENRGQSLTQMALSWILKDGKVTSVLIGASRPEQILENIRALDNLVFSEEELRRIDEIARG
jgi:L-glyceraldehyde 3-phosphate reductase